MQFGKSAFFTEGVWTLSKLVNIKHLCSRVPIVSLTIYALLSLMYVWTEQLTDLPPWRLLRRDHRQHPCDSQPFEKAPQRGSSGPNFSKSKPRRESNIGSRRNPPKNTPNSSFHWSFPSCSCSVTWPSSSSPSSPLLTRSGKDLLFAVSGIPVYCLFFIPEKLPDWVNQIDRCIMITLQKLAFGMPGESKDI